MCAALLVLQVYYATLDPEPTKLLVDLLHQQGQRAIVGKVRTVLGHPAHKHAHAAASYQQLQCRTKLCQRMASLDP
jgi:hypothetical protein